MLFSKCSTNCHCPSNTDRVTILGSNVAFVHTNVGIDPLPEWHFAPED
jgi:hypothetical protein